LERYVPMIDILIVIPLGISSPGTPVLQYLKWCIESLQNQKTSYKYKIIIASDDNIPDETKEYLKSINCDISWYDPYYFFRKGSIWKKIFLEWEKIDTKYIAFCHYDDIWSENKIQSQLDLMNENSLDLSWSSVKIINENNQIVSSDLASRTSLNEDTIKIGQSYAFSHSTILSKEKFLNSGIKDYLERSAPVYEGLHYIFCHKLNGQKDNKSTFYHRVHGFSVSNNLHTETENLSKIREIANYSLNEIIDDQNSINFESIITNLLQK
jgi:hypothetical protein